MKRTIKYFFFTLIGCCNIATAVAQKDSTKKQTVDITSSYKPVLRNAVKINFSATNLTADTSKVLMPYNIPSQNLFYTYQPGSLRPLALTQDTSLDLGIRNYLKAGFGNYSTPYIKAGFSFGDGKNALVNVYADYISSKGPIKNQDYTGMNIKAAGSYFTPTNEISGSLGFGQQDFYLYGYDHLVNNFNKADVLQRFQQINLSAAIKNKLETETGINYKPAIDVNIFNSPGRLAENSLLLAVPLSKTFDETFSVKLAVSANITSYSSKNLDSNVKFNNNVYQLAPELVYAKPAFNIHAGVSPTWDNGKLHVLPNIYGEFKIADKIFLIQAGLVGTITKNTYQHLVTINPWLQTVSQQQNTKETELYGGLKATVGKHFSFSAKASWITFNNMPFFINDTALGNTFVISNDRRVNDFRLHGDISFISQDKFTVIGGLTFNGYNGMKDNERAWGTIPVEISGSLRWWAFKQVLLKSDFWAFSSSPYLLKNNSQNTLGGGADLSIGAELAVTKKISVWLDVNNLFNNKYQRWKNYPVYGLNVLGGAIIRF